MQMIDFTKEMIPQAYQLLQRNYAEECSVVDALPANVQFPLLDSLAENRLGVAAVDGDRLLGFLCAYGPWQPAFCTPDTIGVVSPIHAHAVQRENRVNLWRRLYQAAAEKWAGKGAASHAITLYAHDTSARDALYMYGFGVRCMDLVRPMTNLNGSDIWPCIELPSSRKSELTVLRRALDAHLAQSPCFMKQTPEALEAWLRKKEGSSSRVFAAERDGRLIAFIEADREGENCISNTNGFVNICGAYCLPEYRGTGVANAILALMISTFQKEGYAFLGVDCESFNPTALGFWCKHFNVYTHSVVRRIDENTVQ